jgi:hypothetical protein
METGTEYRITIQVSPTTTTKSEIKAQQGYLFLDIPINEFLNIRELFIRRLPPDPHPPLRILFCLHLQEKFRAMERASSATNGYLRYEEYRNSLDLDFAHAFTFSCIFFGV